MVDGDISVNYHINDPLGCSYMLMQPVSLDSDLRSSPLNDPLSSFLLSRISEEKIVKPLTGTLL